MWYVSWNHRSLLPPVCGLNYAVSVGFSFCWSQSFTIMSPYLRPVALLSSFSIFPMGPISLILAPDRGLREREEEGHPGIITHLSPILDWPSAWWFSCLCLHLSSTLWVPLFAMVSGSSLLTLPYPSLSYLFYPALHTLPILPYPTLPYPTLWNWIYKPI